MLELSYRREKQWNIFSWTATLLVAMIGGTAALRFAEKPVAFTAVFQCAIALAAGGVWFYAMLWIRQNWQLEIKVLQRLHDLGIRFPTNDKGASYLGERKVGLVFGYLQALFLVFVALVVVVFGKLR